MSCSLSHTSSFTFPPTLHTLHTADDRTGLRAHPASSLPLQAAFTCDVHNHRLGINHHILIPVPQDPVPTSSVASAFRMSLMASPTARIMSWLTAESVGVSARLASAECESAARTLTDSPPSVPRGKRDALEGGWTTALLPDCAGDCADGDGDRTDNHAGQHRRHLLTIQRSLRAAEQARPVLTPRCIVDAPGALGMAKAEGCPPGLLISADYGHYCTFAWCLGWCRGNQRLPAVGSLRGASTRRAVHFMRSGRIPCVRKHTAARSDRINQGQVAAAKARARGCSAEQSGSTGAGALRRRSRRGPARRERAGSRLRGAAPGARPRAA